MRLYRVVIDDSGASRGMLSRFVEVQNVRFKSCGTTAACGRPLTRGLWFMAHLRQGLKSDAKHSKTGGGGTTVGKECALECPDGHKSHMERGVLFVSFISLPLMQWRTTAGFMPRAAGHGIRPIRGMKIEMEAR